MRVVEKCRALAVVPLVSLLTVFMAVSPVLADTSLVHVGTVGTHSLTDTYAEPGATCTYREKAPSDFYWEGRLKRLSVRPPNVRAIAGTQKVGWRFLVERLANSVGTWTTKFTSPIQYARTTPTQNAPFSRMSVGVDVPTGGADELPEYLYRVVVTMFWYHPGGALQGSAAHRVGSYRLVRTGFLVPTTSQSWPCEGWEYFS